MDDVAEEEHLLVTQISGHDARSVVGEGHAHELRLTAAIAAVELVEEGWEAVYARGMNASKTLADSARQKLQRARSRRNAA